MPFEPNKVVTMNYNLKDTDGNIIDSSDSRGSLSFLSGTNQILPKLEEAVSKMLIGSKKNIKLTAADAYGEFNNDAYQVVERSTFPEDAVVEEGIGYISTAEDGQQTPFKISKIEDDKITLDFNHPLAGVDLEFEVELLDIRDASVEEKSHGHVHGPNGHDH
ncbi:peptidylprolyl isomerase [Bacteroidota bacterium]